MNIRSIFRKFFYINWLLRAGSAEQVLQYAFTVMIFDRTIDLGSNTNQESSNEFR
jgi:hypothetical protein